MTAQWQAAREEPRSYIRGRYASSMYVDQLSKGGSYALAAPAISICLLNHVLFSDAIQAHHRFQMLDLESGRELNNAIEVHTVELTKYNLQEETISQASKLEQWAFLLLRAQDYDADSLKRLLSGIDFETAINTIEMISAKTEDKQMYDQREKAQRDYEWALSGARQEGREEGRDEGELIGKIRLLEELLGQVPTARLDLLALGVEPLTALLVDLQQRLRDRQA